MITPILDPGKKEPLYEQLYEFIKEEIRSGRLGEGEKLPSKRTLAAYLRVSRSTVESAYSQLADEGYIRARERSGFYVRQAERKFARKQALPEQSPPDSPKRTYLYDLRTSGVDTEHFPFTVWARLSREVLSEYGQELLRATHPQGMERLRICISRYLYDFRRVEADPEQIVIGAGTEYLLGLLIQLLGTEKRYAVEEPGYPRVHRILTNYGVKPAYIPVDEEGMRVEGLRQSGAQVVHVMPSHQFPTGAVLSAGRREALLQWAGEEEGRYILEDDYDSEFRFQGKPVPALQGMGAPEKVVYFYTFAKSLAPSLRIGYMVLPKSLMGAWREKFQGYSCSVPSFEQYTLCRFMEKGYYERHLNRMKTLYRGRQDALAEALDIPGFRLIGRDAGLHFMLEVTEESYDEEELVERAARAGVYLRGLGDYYASGAEQDGPPRLLIGYGAYDETRLREAARILRKAWEGE